MTVFVLASTSRVVHVPDVTPSKGRSAQTGLRDNMDMKIRPHDLRCHSATYASRNSIPLEVISKVILRRQHLKTTRMYLGKISEVEALRWVDVPHGK